MRSADCVARLGGDEFAILMPETNAGAAQQAAEKIIRAFKNSPPKGLWPVTLSAGVVTFLSPPPDSDAMIKIADNMMYSAKNTGKNTIRYFIYSSNEE